MQLRVCVTFNILELLQTVGCYSACSFLMVLGVTKSSCVVPNVPLPNWTVHMLMLAEIADSHTAF